MESEKVKEIKELLRCLNGEKACTNCYINEIAQEQGTFCINVVADMTLDLINELENENERIKNIGLNEDITVREWLQENQQLRIANKLYAVELGKKDKKEYENLITDIRLETLKDFREKYKEALKEAVKGENVDCFVESLKIFDKTIEEKICDLK